MRETLGDRARTPAERLSSYFDRIAAAVTDTQRSIGCMVSHLAGEIANHSEELRDRLRRAFAEPSLLLEEVFRLNVLRRRTI